MPTTIVEFSKKHHLEQTVDALLLVRKSDPEYPPPLDTDTQRGSMAKWLLGDEILARWVAVVDERVVGHIQVTKPHSYLQATLRGALPQVIPDSDLVEIGKFFVNPSCQETGIGTLLFKQASSFIRNQRKTAVLAVLPSSIKALEFYVRKGMRRCGSFTGVHGENLVLIGALTA
jgi:GNAT superfamily N-acetyltransferase